MTDREHGPFDSEAQVDATRAYAALRAAFDANPGVGAGDPARLRLLAGACEAAGVELGDYDARLLRWLAGYENSTCVQLAGMIRRAYEAGLAARDKGSGVEWGVRFKVGRSPCGTASEHAAKDEAEARETVTSMRAEYPEWNAALITRTRERAAGPWELAPGEDGTDG